MRWSIVLLLTMTPAGAEEPAFPTMFPDQAMFENALKTSPQLVDEKRRITGIVVPHHLVAVDLIARGFRCAEFGKYKRVIILSPDHFKRSDKSFATTRKGFETVWGTLKCDTTLVDRLLAACPLAGESELFGKEHGVHAVTPFIARFFPQAEVLTVALRIDSTPEEWRQLAAALVPLVDDETLIVQSTDFSHFLSEGQSRARDQQTLDVLAMGDAEGIVGLDQPANLDSKACQYVNMVLQKRIHGAVPVVVENRNSGYYVKSFNGVTTSYIVQVYEAGDRPAAAWDGGDSWYFGGDVFFGRYVARVLANEGRAKPILDELLRITKGRPMAVNLEGVIVPDLPEKLKQMPLLMEEKLTLEWLSALNVKVAGLANNHAMDSGEEGLRRTAEILTGKGIHPLLDGEVFDAGKFRITALTDLCNTSLPRTGRLGRDMISKLIGNLETQGPVFAMIHSGIEFHSERTPRQAELYAWLAEPSVAEIPGQIRWSRSPVRLILGAHPHVASGSPTMTGDVLAVDSLGNFIFDQPKGSGALVEVLFFEHGTRFTRWIPIGNPITRPVIPSRW